MVSEHDFEAVIELLSDPRRRVLTLGGRVSAFLARYLASQLHLIRPASELIDPERSNPADHLVDLGRRDILVVFDYRRYQSDTISSAKVAAGRGSTVVLVTDPCCRRRRPRLDSCWSPACRPTVMPLERAMVSGVALTEALDRRRARASGRDRACADAPYGRNSVAASSTRRTRKVEEHHSRA